MPTKRRQRLGRTSLPGGRLPLSPLRRLHRRRRPGLLLLLLLLRLLATAPPVRELRLPRPLRWCLRPRARLLESAGHFRTQPDTLRTHKPLQNAREKVPTESAVHTSGEALRTSDARFRRRPTTCLQHLSGGGWSASAVRWTDERHVQLRRGVEPW